MPSNEKMMTLENFTMTLRYIFFNS